VAPKIKNEPMVLGPICWDDKWQSNYNHKFFIKNFTNYHHDGKDFANEHVLFSG
jgi:hypothetical protein